MENLTQLEIDQLVDESQMPEGWAKLVNNFSPERLAFAMQLMKEMAEALNRVNEYEKKWNLVMRQADQLKVKQVLQKFKDWK